MKEVECGQQRTAVALGILFALCVGALLVIVGIAVNDILQDSRL